MGLPRLSRMSTSPGDEYESGADGRSRRFEAKEENETSAGKDPATFLYQTFDGPIALRAAPATGK